MSGPMPRRTSSIAMMRRALPGLEIIIGLAHRGICPPCIGPPHSHWRTKDWSPTRRRFGWGLDLDQVDLLPGSVIMLVWSGPVSSF